MSYLLKISFFAALLVGIYIASASEVFGPIALDLSDVRAGDVALRRGSSAASLAVLSNDPKSSYSHLGVVCLIDGKVFVVHATPDTRKDDLVKLEPIEDFFSSKAAGAGAIYKFDAPDSIAAQVAGKALEYYESGTRFDRRFDLSSDSAVYCTELVWRSFKNAGIKLDLETRTTKTLIWREKLILYPSEFTDPKYFYPLSVKD